MTTRSNPLANPDPPSFRFRWPASRRKPSPLEALCRRADAATDPARRRIYDAAARAVARADMAMSRCASPPTPQAKTAFAIQQLKRRAAETRDPHRSAILARAAANLARTTS